MASQLASSIRKSAQIFRNPLSLTSNASKIESQPFRSDKFSRQFASSSIRSSQPASPSISHETIHQAFNPYKAKKQWPPDFKNLSPRYQLRLERKYRRRMKLKFARPVWTKFTILLQWGSAGFVLIYGVLFMDWSGAPHGSDKEPFEDVRNWFKEAVGGMWTRPLPKSAASSKHEQAQVVSSTGSNE